ncbi:PREDICTED: UPF0538 protein C2orf76 homolog [Amphimedon queenslandica]|uniref:Uncharacterized protein n=1 Tax=Amphimedon queenslandica TaxID=400682 RepID=A0A1X7VUG6_AMPQE|nr:PREDICTED: UPF0538 protein C2orf76 homolog [Amphimedon queenslandica]|eukprot:XP_011403543.1 PREDICTED: UPF0538 protein C2orf76 homolog [Amphimedon queenslandica]
MASESQSSAGLTITIRLIRSFEHRNIRYIVLKDVDPSLTIQDLMDQINKDLQSSHILPVPFRKHQFNCMKINSYAHGHKSNDTAITLGRNEWILDPSKTILESNIRNETEISYFNKSDYERYESHPQLLW